MLCTHFNLNASVGFKNINKRNIAVFILFYKPSLNKSRLWLPDIQDSALHRLPQTDRLAAPPSISSYVYRRLSEVVFVENPANVDSSSTGEVCSID